MATQMQGPDRHGRRRRLQLRQSAALYRHRYHQGLDGGLADERCENRIGRRACGCVPAVKGNKHSICSPPSAKRWGGVGGEGGCSVCEKNSPSVAPPGSANPPPPPPPPPPRERARGGRGDECAYVDT